MEPKRYERASNIELLRIIAMLMIIGVHYLGSSDAETLISQHTVNNGVFICVMSLCNIGVNLFVLITGYFMINAKGIKVSKMAKLLIDTLIYGMLLYGVSIWVGTNNFQLGELIKSAFPILAGYRWFIKAYCILYILIPFLNKVLQVITKKQYHILIIIILCLFSVWPSILPYPPMDDYGYGFIHLIVLYTISGYIRRFGVKLTNKLLILVALGGYIITILICFVGNPDIPFFSTLYSYKWAYNSPSNILFSVAIFILFTRVSFTNRIINILASSAFAVFLIHGDHNIMNYLFIDICRAPVTFNSIGWLPYMLLCIIVIYIICFIIDSVKKRLLNSLIDVFLDKLNLVSLQIKV